jgi:hypothetical protein
MRPFTDDLDEFDSARARRIYEKQRRKEMQFGSGLAGGLRHKRRNDDHEDYEDFEEYGDYEEYDDYDEDEFDSYAQVHRPY